MEPLKGADVGQARHRLVRRLRAGLVTPLPGGLGSPSVPIMGDCLEWLDAARTKGGESCPDRGGRSPPVRARKLRPRGQKSPRWSAAGRASFAKDAHAARRELNGCASRRSIPLCFAEGHKQCPAQAGRSYGVPGAAKNTGDGAWLFENLSAHSGARAKRANPESREACGASLDSGSGAYAPSRNDEVSKNENGRDIMPGHFYCGWCGDRLNAPSSIPPAFPSAAPE